jgi:flagellin
MATINTNIGATRAANALATNERDMNTSMERLSTGKRINSAQDDAAGLAIASKMTSQINSLDQAVRNAGDAISMVQSADGAMIEITNMVQRMRELAIQSISDTNTTSDRSALNLEFQALAAEISRIGGNTQWNGGNLLDGLNGTAGTSTFHIGANANQVITATFPTIGSTEGDFSAATTTEAAATVTGVAQTFTIAVTDAAAGSLANDFAISDGTNTTTVANMSGVTNIASLVTTLNGATGLSAGSPAATLYTASATADGSGITLTATVAGARSDTFTASTLSPASGTAGVTAVTLASQQTTLSLDTTFSTLRTGDSITYTVDGQAASAVIAINASTGAMTLTSNSPVTHGTNGNASTGVGTVTLAVSAAGTHAGGQALTLTGTNAGVTFAVDNVQVTRGIAADVGATDISSFKTATAALNVLDTAVAAVNMKRAELGAIANRLEYASDNMANISMNARQSRSRVEDADYASETTELARTQIIQQAGTAMLAQANQSQQAVLALLR